MNNRIGVIILAIATVGLTVALFLVKKNAHEEKDRDTDTILTFSNRLVSANRDLDDQRNVNVTLTNDLVKSFEQVLTFSNKLTETSTALTKSEESLKTATDDIVKRDARIAGLENQNQELDKRALELSATITNLSQQIADTQHKLAVSQGDKAFLERELQRLLSQKAEMEAQFNDLDTVRNQVKKLKEELYTARRLEWIRRGISFDQKGGELMMQPKTAKTNTGPRYDLNVEVGSDGTIRVTPVTPETNSPAAAPAP